jgi:hypothetical protein
MDKLLCLSTRYTSPIFGQTLSLQIETHFSYGTNVGFDGEWSVAAILCWGIEKGKAIVTHRYITRME